MNSKKFLSSAAGIMALAAASLAAGIDLEKTATVSASLPDTTAELKADTLYVKGVFPEAKENKFVSVFVKFNEPVDLSKKSIAFTPVTSTPKSWQCLKVYCYNEGSERPCLGFVSWASPVSAKPVEYTLVPEKPSTWPIQWATVNLAEEPADRIDRIEFCFGSTVSLAKFDATISNLHFPDRPQLEDWSPIVEYADAPANVKHPVGPFSAEDIERAKRNYKEQEWAKKRFEYFLYRAKDIMEIDPERDISEGDIFDHVNCPKCGALDNTWILRSDKQSIECRKCHVVFPSEELKEEYTETIPGPKPGMTRTLTYALGKEMELGDDKLGTHYYLTAMLNNRKFGRTSWIEYAAYIYAITDDLAYAQKVRDILVRIAEVYPNYAFKFRTQAYKSPRFNYMAGKLGGWKYGDSVRVASFAVAYDLTVNSGVYSDEDKVKIENGIFREYLNMITAHRPNADVTTNAVPAHLTAAALCADLTGNQDLMKNYVLNGEGSLIPFLQKFYYRDGVWSENTASYSHMSTAPLPKLIETIINGDESGKLLDKSLYRNIFASLGYQVMPDGCLPALNDSNCGDHFTPDFAELTYCHFPSERNLALLNRSISKTEGSDYSVFKRDASLPAAAPEEEKRFLSTAIIAGSNWAILRPELNPAATALIFDYGFVNNGHTHNSNLNFVYYDNKEELIFDYGYLGFADELRDWQITPLAHNMLSIDGAFPSTKRQGKLLTLGQSKYVQTVAAEELKAFENCEFQQRTFFLVSASQDKHYLVEFFRVKGGNEHLYSMQVMGKFQNEDFGTPKATPLNWGSGFFTGAENYTAMREASITDDAILQFQWLSPKNNLTSLFWSVEKSHPQTIMLGKTPSTRNRAKPDRKARGTSFLAHSAGGYSNLANVIAVNADGIKVERLAVEGDGAALLITYAGNKDIAAIKYSGESLKIVSMPELEITSKYTFIRTGENGFTFRNLPDITGKVIALEPEKDEIVVELAAPATGLSSNYIFFDRRDGACRILESTSEGENRLRLKLDPVDGCFMKAGDSFTAFDYSLQ